MDKIKGGFTMWARQAIESEIFFYKPDKWFKIWFFIVSQVNHKDTKLFARGEGLMTYMDIQHKTKATKDMVDKCLRFLKKTQMATTRKTTRGMVVKVLNYGLYQDVESYKAIPEAKSKRNGSDTINKNVKNEKKGEGTRSKKRSGTDSFGKDKMIYLKPVEYKKLAKKIGAHVDGYISKIANWKLTKKKNDYDNDYAALGNWIRKDIEDGRLKITWQDFREDDFESKDEYELTIKQYIK